MAMKWFVVHTYSGQEKRAKDNLQAEIKKHHLEPAFGEVLIPQENVLEVVKGHKKHTMRKFYPGYLFVQMELNERTFGIVKITPKFTGFLGGTIVDADQLIGGLEPLFVWLFLGMMVGGVGVCVGIIGALRWVKGNYHLE